MRFLLNISQAIEQAKDLCRTGKYQDALMALDAARIRHNHPALFIEMARIFSELANNDAAGKILQVALGQFPNDITVIIAYANYAYQSNQPALGLAVTTPLLDTPLCTLDLKLTHAHLLKAGNHDADAQAIYKSVLEKEPRNLIALSSLGSMHLDARDYEGAIHYFKTALQTDPANAHIKTQLAYCYFRNGNLKDGWAMYEGRFDAGIVTRRNFSAPRWNGQPIKNGTLLVWGEQAVGEEILYASMIDDAAALCGSDVMVECDARLKPLFERSLNGMTSVARTEPPAIGEIAAQCSAGQLGHYVRKNFSEFPQRTAYLKADADKTAQLRARYTAMKEALGKSGRIIGISWKSKPLRQGDPKSTTLADWAMIFEHSPHLFVSLQHGDCAEDFALAAQKNWALIDDKDVNQHASLDDFAAQVCAMDQVITVSNTTAHMAGACGVQTAVLVVQSRGLMWHWFDKVGFDKVGFDKVGDQTLTTSPWYPSVRLLRQSIDGVWDDVIRAAAAFLK